MAIDLPSIRSAFDRAAIDPSAWPQTLETVGEALNSRLFSLIRYHQHDVELLTPPGDDGHLARYKAGEWLDRDPRGRRSLSTKAMEVITDDELLGPGERETSDFYRDFAEKEDAPYCVNWRFGDGPRQFVFSNLRSRESGPPGREEIEAMRAIRDSATAAALLSAHMHHVHERGLIEGLAMAGTAAVALGDGGEIVAATPQAEALLGQDFIVEGGRLGCADPAASMALERLNQRLAVVGGDIDTSAFQVPRQGGRGLVCYAVANNGAGLDIFTDVRAVLLLKDADATARPRADVLALRFGLTPAEIDVAGQVASGESLAAISTARGVARGTTRAILRSIFRKTGARRQSELAALLARL